MFKIAKRDVADVSPTVYMAGDAGLTIGMALKVSGGKVAKAGAKDEVTFVCMGERTADGTYPVIAVHPYMYFETTSTATVAATLVGTSVALHTDALTVTATADGPFVIDDTDGAATNSTVVGHFVKPSAGAGA